jgi:hypothetical protein
MRSLTAADLLDVWEQARTESPVRQALVILAHACPELAPDELAQLSIGERDRRLLMLRASTFGSELTGVATCHCGERLVFNFQVEDVLSPPRAKSEQEMTQAVGEYRVRFRLPNSLDLTAIASISDVTLARQPLFERCVLAAEQNGMDVAVGQLPAEVEAAVIAEMAAVDPQADVQLALACPNCGAQIQADLDIASFFWSELDARAQRLLREVHTLATAYGWNEPEILTLSSWRRQCYLEMVGG